MHSGRASVEKEHAHICFLFCLYATVAGNILSRALRCDVYRPFIDVFSSSGACEPGISRAPSVQSTLLSEVCGPPSSTGTCPRRISATKADSLVGPCAIEPFVVDPGSCLKLRNWGPDGSRLLLCQQAQPGRWPAR